MPAVERDGLGNIVTTVTRVTRGPLTGHLQTSSTVTDVTIIHFSMPSYF